MCSPSRLMFFFSSSINTRGTRSIYRHSKACCCCFMQGEKVLGASCMVCAWSQWATVYVLPYLLFFLSFFLFLFPSSSLFFPFFAYWKPMYYIKSSNVSPDSFMGKISKFTLILLLALKSLGVNGSS